LSLTSQISKRPAASGAYVGCSGWAYTSWKPDFYPAKLPAKKLLEYYATRLNSVEVNYTFRNLPSASIAAGWLAATGPDFRFSFKAPQRITHILRLKNCASAFAGFVQSIQPVIDAKRFGTVLFQLPPNFKADPERLESFLSDAASTKLRLAFEFRHESWFAKNGFADEIYPILRKYEAALCVAESDELATPDVATAPFTCYRFRKSDYTPEQLDAVRDLLRQRAQTGDVFAYFKHEEEPTGALRAAAVLEGLHST
jgi:uncharacterized protein YecE (DUF72 family)